LNPALVDAHACAPGGVAARIGHHLPLLAAGPGSAEALRLGLRRKPGDISRRVEGLTALRDERARRLDESMAARPLRPSAS
jgi:MerR family copper efflux transcriptional regulator